MFFFFLIYFLLYCCIISIIVVNKDAYKSSSEETVQAIVCGGSPGGRCETNVVGFVKDMGFKPGVKERGSYGCTEW